MRVTVQFMGPLKDFVGEQTAEFDLPEGAAYGALLDEIGRRFGQCFPEKIWDRNGGGFKAGILIIGTGRDLDDRETLLKDGEEIKVLPLLGGG
jgi:molybdopterin converting factor small subunit